MSSGDVSGSYYRRYSGGNQDTSSASRKGGQSHLRRLGTDHHHWSKNNCRLFVCNETLSLFIELHSMAVWL